MNLADIARGAIFPTMMVGGVVGAWFALESSMAPELVVAIVGIAAALVVAVLERLLPRYGEWNRSHGDIGTDVVHTIVSGVAVPELVRIATLSATAAGAAFIAARAGGGLWPNELPHAAQLVLALVLIEAAQYSFHRAEHTFEPLWRLHSVHHSVPRLYWLNTARFHPIEAGLNYLLAVPLVSLLGCPEQVGTLVVVVFAIHGPLQHSNVDIRLGPLNWIFSQAELHRWHHSPQRAEANHNYGAVLIIFDSLFGTRFDPGGDPPTDVGIEEIREYPGGYLGQIAAPFLWPGEDP